MHLPHINGLISVFPKSHIKHQLLWLLWCHSSRKPYRHLRPPAGWTAEVSSKGRPRRAVVFTCTCPCPLPLARVCIRQTLIMKHYRICSRTLRSKGEGLEMCGYHDNCQRAVLQIYHRLRANLSVHAGQLSDCRDVSKTACLIECWPRLHMHDFCHSWNCKIIRFDISKKTEQNIISVRFKTCKKCVYVGFWYRQINIVLSQF